MCTTQVLEYSDHEKGLIMSADDSVQALVEVKVLIKSNEWEHAFHYLSRYPKIGNFSITNKTLRPQNAVQGLRKVMTLF